MHEHDHAGSGQVHDHDVGADHTHDHDHDVGADHDQEHGHDHLHEEDEWGFGPDAGPRFIVALSNFLVDDVVKTAEYYRDVLGFEVDFVFGEPPCYASVFRSGALISFTKSEPPGCRNSVSSSGATSGSDLLIVVSNLHEIYEEMHERGANPSPVVEREYGMREFEIADCNDYRLVLAEEIP